MPSVTKVGHLLVSGCSSEIMKEKKRYLFCGRSLKCLSPLKGANSETTSHLLSNLFRVNTLKGTAKASTVGGAFEVEHPQLTCNP